jgi:hypothetical protein
MAYSEWDRYRAEVRWSLTKEVGPSAKELEVALNKAVAEIIALRGLLRLRGDW